MKIGIVGAGPRGLSMAERLLQNKTDEQTIQIILFDPSGPGGSVWRMDQPAELLMNSVSQQVTLFTDETLSSGGVVSLGPNLYQWSKTEAVDFIKQQNSSKQKAFIEEARGLKKDEQSSRCFYGLYQRWFFERLKKEYPENLSVIKALVTDIQKKSERYQLKTSKQEFFVDQLVLATGHWENELNAEEKILYNYAKKENLFYQPPANPADVPVASIPPKENVILKGLGLSFFDYVGLFTIGRGGYFESEGETLIYHPSGLEPTVYCGSRKGLPYFPRGTNQKQGGATALPKLITQENLSRLYHSQQLTGTKFFELLKKDTELFYYKKIIEEYQLKISSTEFERVFLSDEKNTWQQKYPELLPYSWSWDYFVDPLRDSSTPFTQASRRFITYQIKEALKGNCSGAVAATIDALKDWRDPIRQVIDWEIFTVKEYEKLLWGWFTPLNAFLTIGPPVIRTKELAALIDAGIFRLIEPPIDVQLSEGYFSVEHEGHTRKSKYLIEARIPKNDILQTTNPALKNLREEHLVRSYKYQTEKEQYSTNAIDVIRVTNQVVNESGVEERMYCVGIPVEGVDWLTAAVARPYTDPWNLRQLDHIAQQMLGIMNTKKIPKRTDLL